MPRPVGFPSMIALSRRFHRNTFARCLVQGGLTESQRANYSAAIIILWIVFAVILVLMAWAIF